MVGTLYTLGYAGLRDATDLRARLGNDAEIVIDIRMRPYSNNRAFSTATRRTVEEAGYGYRHLVGLGNVEYRTGGTRLARPEEIGTLVDLLRAGIHVAIMCACRDADSCHRRVVAGLARQQMADLEIVDL